MLDFNLPNIPNSTFGVYFFLSRSSIPIELEHPYRNVKIMDNTIDVFVLHYIPPFLYLPFRFPTPFCDPPFLYLKCIRHICKFLLSFSSPHVANTPHRTFFQKTIIVHKCTAGRR